MLSRRGYGYDNAVMEVPFWSVQHERTKFESFADSQGARLSDFSCTETFFKPQRHHQLLDYLTPSQFETQHASALAEYTIFPRCPPVLN